MRIAFVTEEWIPWPWRDDDRSVPQPRYVGCWERDEAFEWGPGWNDLTEAVCWGRARAPIVRVALARTGRERLALSLGRDSAEGSEILQEESARVAAEIAWPHTLVDGFGGRVDLHEASGGWEQTGEYAVSAVALQQPITDPDDLYQLESQALSGSPFRTLTEAVQRAASESAVVVVRVGTPIAGIFLSAGREKPEGLELPRVPDSWL